MEKKTSFNSKASSRDRTAVPLILPADFISQDLKKTARKGFTVSALPKKLFGKSGDKGGSNNEKKVKALTDVKVNANTRSLAMVLRSERELLSLNSKRHRSPSSRHCLKIETRRSLLFQWANALGATVIGTLSTEEEAKYAKTDGCHHVILHKKLMNNLDIIH